MNPGVVIRSMLYLKPSMIYWRIHRTIKGAAVSALEQTGLSRIFSQPDTPPPHNDIAILSSKYHCEEIDLHGRVFTFLNQTVELPDNQQERRASVARQPLLWQFHYGYHDYLLALLENESNNATIKTQVLAFMRQWTGDYPLAGKGARKSAWHPYVLSIRIESWIRLSRVFPDEPFIAAHISQMARVLRRNMEFGTMANHLLKNIKAMVLAGLYFDGEEGKKYLDYGLALLDRELREQILDDGMHFERSPMYHVAMTSDVLDLMEALGEKSTALVQSTASAMTAFLGRIVHPDGEVPFFNDSTSSFFLRTDEVLERGKRLCAGIPPTAPSQEAAPPIDRLSGLLVHRDEMFHLVFDGGNAGPDYQPGHAHCDTLSFELSVNGRRFITDTGVYHYKESPERTWSRCTAAHNTIRIDGTEQSEIWKSFRVGRRAKSVALDERHQNGLTVFHAAHDGYEQLQKGLIHERFAIIAPGEWIAIIDMIHGASIRGIESNLHLAPGVDADVTGTGIVLRQNGLSLQLQTGGFYSDMLPRLFESEYYPTFGKKVFGTSVQWAAKRALPSVGGYILCFGGAPPRIEYSSNPLQFRILNASGVVYESLSGLP